MARIAFVQEEVRDRFGVMMLSAALREHGHEREVFIHNASENFLEEVKAYKPDIISFSTMTPGIGFAKKYVELFKKNTDAFIVMGGPHPTFYPNIIEEEPCLDAICIGEGEGAILDLAEAVDKGEDIYHIPNIWARDRNDASKIYKNDLRPIIEISTQPELDRELYYQKYPDLANAPTKKFFAGKGCPFDCTYCFNHSLKELYKGKGKYTQFRPVDSIIDEILSMNEKYGMKWMQIITDAVNIDRKWYIEFLDKYKEKVGIPFICNVRIDRIDEEIVRKMKEAGCDRVNYGIEHGNYEIRKNVLKRNMTDEVIIKAGQLFKKYKIRVLTANIIGVPHETVETAMETVLLNRKVKPEIAQCFVLQPYPKTNIYNYSKEHGFLDEQYDYSRTGTGFQEGFSNTDYSMQLKLKDRKKLTKLLLLFDFLVHFKYLDPFINIILSLPFTRLYKIIYIFPMICQRIKYSDNWKKKRKVLKILLDAIIKD